MFDVIFARLLPESRHAGLPKSFSKQYAPAITNELICRSWRQLQGPGTRYIKPTPTAGENARPVLRHKARTLVKQFEARGRITGDPHSAAIWVVIAYCEGGDVPYEVKTSGDGKVTIINMRPNQYSQFRAV